MKYINFFSFFACLFACFYLAPSVIAQDDKQVEQLIQQLQVKDKHAQVAALDAVKRLGPKAQTALPALTELLKDPDDDLRKGSAEAIGMIGAEARTAVPALTDALRDKN